MDLLSRGVAIRGVPCSSRQETVNAAGRTFNEISRERHISTNQLLRRLRERLGVRGVNPLCISLSVGERPYSLTHGEDAV